MSKSKEKTKLQPAKRTEVPIIVSLLKPRTTSTYDDWMNIATNIDLLLFQMGFAL